MEDTDKKAFELLIQKSPEYQENKEDFKKNHSETYSLIEYYEKQVAEQKAQEFIKENYVSNYHLKKHFGVLNQEEIQRQKEVDAKSAKIFGISSDTYVEMQNEDTKYFDDVKVLLTYDYPYYSAYKIGNSIEDSEFIECSLYTNDIYKIIDIFLKTGEKLHNV
jgi:hypothetical protein